MEPFTCPNCNAPYHNLNPTCNCLIAVAHSKALQEAKRENLTLLDIAERNTTRQLQIQNLFLTNLTTYIDSENFHSLTPPSNNLYEWVLLELAACHELLRKARMI